jgi:hypothetical protein
MQYATALVIVFLSVASCSRGSPQEPNPPAQPTEPARASAAEPERVGPVGFEMRNVRLRAAPDIVLHVSSLHGQLISKHRAPPVFDDQRSFYIEVDSAELSMDSASMTALVNDVFAYQGSPLSDLKVALREGRVKQDGKLKKGIPVPFSVEADVDATGGQVRLHPVRVKTVGIPTTKVMDLFGIELDDLLRIRAGRGVAVRDNDLFLAPSQMLPSPEVRGKVSSALVRGDRLILVLGSPPAPAPTRSAGPGNYIWFRGGRIRFGRLTMSDADLQLIDADPRDTFDFFSERYNEQLVAGYSRNTPSGALRTYMPDYEDLGAGRLGPPPIRGAPAGQRRPRRANALR